MKNQKFSESNFINYSRDFARCILVYFYTQEIEKAHRLALEKDVGERSQEPSDFHLRWRNVIALEWKGLTQKEERVLSLRFGLEDGHLWTLEEVAKELDIPLKSIPRLEWDALTKIGMRLHFSKQVENHYTDVGSATMFDPFEFYFNAVYRMLPLTQEEAEADSDLKSNKMDAELVTYGFAAQEERALLFSTLCCCLSEILKENGFDKRNASKVIHEIEEFKLMSRKIARLDKELAFLSTSVEGLI